MEPRYDSVRSYKGRPQGRKGHQGPQGRHIRGLGNEVGQNPCPKPQDSKTVCIETTNTLAERGGQCCRLECTL